MPRQQNRIFGILALAAGMLLVMLEMNTYRQGAAVSWFWMLVAGLAIAMGLFDIAAKRP